MTFLESHNDHLVVQGLIAFGWLITEQLQGPKAGWLYLDREKDGQWESLVVSAQPHDWMINSLQIYLMACDSAVRIGASVGGSYRFIPPERGVL